MDEALTSEDTEEKRTLKLLEAKKQAERQALIDEVIKKLGYDALLERTKTDEHYPKVCEGCKSDQIIDFPKILKCSKCRATWKNTPENPIEFCPRCSTRLEKSHIIRVWCKPCNFKYNPETGQTEKGEFNSSNIEVHMDFLCLSCRKESTIKFTLDDPRLEQLAKGLEDWIRHKEDLPLSAWMEK